MTKKVHIVLQGKGGVGKSYVASLLAQFHQDRQLPLACVDTDPVNATFFGYASFNVRRCVMMEGTTLVERGFDAMIESIVTEDSHFVIDNGASTYIPLANYLLENDAIRVMADAGKVTVVHTVITGNQALLDTLRGLDSLCSQFPPQAEIVVWLNEFFGPIESDGKTFEDMKVYKNYRERISSLIRIPKQTSSTFEMDVALMLEKKMTFAEAIQSIDFGLMAKQRLTMVKRTIFNQLANAV
jgi:hypothetical protein